MTRTTHDATVTIQETPEMHREVFTRVIDFLMRHKAFSGESICQRDNPTIEAPGLLAELVDDVIRPTVEWHD